MKQTILGIFLLLILLNGVSSFGQGIRVGPDGEFREQTLSLPYAFYNESFGFAVGYAYGVVGRPQKQATLLATAMAGSKGSAMGFLIGRDDIIMTLKIKEGLLESSGCSSFRLPKSGGWRLPGTLKHCIPI